MEPIFVDTAYGVVIYIYPLFKKVEQNIISTLSTFPLLEKVEQKLYSLYPLFHF